MPANLPQQYLMAEEKYRQANSDDEKLLMAQQMLKLLPKHKGTEKIQAELKKKISTFKKSCAKKEKKENAYVVNKNGFPQIVVVGAPNSGKSKLLSSLGNAKLQVEDYPFTTRAPFPVIVTYEDVSFQIVDMPPIASNYMENWMPGVIRAADAILWTIDYSDNQVLENIEAIQEKLESQKISLLYNNNLSGDIKNHTIKNTLLIATKSDLPDVAENIEIIKDLFDVKFSPMLVSVASDLQELKQSLFAILKLIRVYPKPPGQKPDMKNPILLPKNSNILDFATKIHHSLAKEVKSARIWNSCAHNDGKNIPRDSILEDKNIVELTK